MTTQIHNVAAATISETRIPPFVVGPHAISPLNSPMVGPHQHSPILSAIAASHLRTAELLRSVAALDAAAAHGRSTRAATTTTTTPPTRVTPLSTKNTIADHLRSRHSASSSHHRLLQHQGDMERLLGESSPKVHQDQQHRDEWLLLQHSWQQQVARLRVGNGLQSLAGLSTTSPLLPASALLTSRLALQSLLAAPQLSTHHSTSPPTVALGSSNRSTPEPMSTTTTVTVPPPGATTTKTSHKRLAKVLAMDCDRDSLSDYQCLIRQHMELFEATAEDSVRNVQGRNKPVVVGQVGIRCRHCAMANNTQASLYFPTKLDRIYQAAQNLSAFHLCRDCPHLPTKAKQELVTQKERKSPAGGGKRYWAEGVQCLGVVQVDGGLFFGKPPPTTTRTTTISTTNP